MHTYKFFWMNGRASEVHGHTPKEAFNRATHKTGHSLTDLLRFEELN